MKVMTGQGGEMQVSFGLAEKAIAGFATVVITGIMFWLVSTVQAMSVSMAVMSGKMEVLNGVPAMNNRLGNLELRQDRTETDVSKLTTEQAALENRVDSIERVLPN